jgi:hypothetical protein
MKLTEEEQDETAPEELVAAFSRCSNYPKDKEGVLFLAQGLRKAATASGTQMAAIVARCQELSQYCPTDYDLLQVANELALLSRPRAPMGCRECQGSGWRSYVKHVEAAAGEYDAHYAEYCSCERGNYLRLARQEQARKNEEKKAAARK